MKSKKYHEASTAYASAPSYYSVWEDVVSYVEPSTWISSLWTQEPENPIPATITLLMTQIATEPASHVPISAATSLISALLSAITPLVEPEPASAHHTHYG